MVTLNDIRRYAKDVARSFHPDRVVLFGSYADGTATHDSDVDLLVVMDHSGRDVEQAFTIRRAIKRSFPLDLVVRTPFEMRRRLAERDSFMTTISRTGKTLYEKRIERVG